MATDAFGKGAGEYGLLGSAMAVGSLGGALLAAGRVRVRLRLILGAAVAFGLAEIVAGLMPGYVAFALWCPVLGLSAITLLNSANATMQVESDPEVRGRVMALYFTVLAGGTPLGSPVIGWIGAHLGPRWCLFVGGAMVLVGVAIAVLVKRYAEARIARANAPVTRGTGDLVLDLSAD